MIHHLKIHDISLSTIHIVSRSMFKYSVEIGDICFAYDGNDIIGWLSITALLPEMDRVELHVLQWGYDGESD
jgi:hypothetical protein